MLLRHIPEFGSARNPCDVTAQVLTVPESFVACTDALLGDPDRLKLYHFARFDVAIMRAYLGIIAAPLYCTRTASRLVRTYTDRHGLKDLVK